MIDEYDPHVNALGIKGVGEIGHHRLGRRGRQRGLARPPARGVRRFPIGIDDLVAAG